MKRGRNEEERGDEKTRGFDRVSGPVKNHRDSDHEQRRQQAPRDPCRIEIDPASIHHARVAENFLQRGVDALQPRISVEKSKCSHHLGVERTVPLPALRVERQPRERASRSRKRSEGQEGDSRQQDRASAPQRSKQCGKRGPWSEFHQPCRGSQKRAGAPPGPFQCDERCEEQRDSDSVQMPFSRGFDDRERMEGVEKRRAVSEAARGAQGSQATHDEEIEESRESLDRGDVSVRRREGQEGHQPLRHRPVDAPDLGMVYLRCLRVTKTRQPWAGRSVGIRVDSPRQDPSVPAVAVDVLRENRWKQDEGNTNQDGQDEEDEKSEKRRIALNITQGAILAGYYLVLVALAFYGSHRFRLILRHYRAPSGDPPPPDAPAGATPPTILVQLPIFNERFVVERLLRASAALRSPGEVRIQLLDDSIDDTPAVAAPIVAELQARGVQVTHVRRGSREGFKAGALSEGLRLDALNGAGAAELVAIFDADFVPDPDFLERTVPHLRRAGVGLVQARWDHLNREESLLTRLQAIFLDGHFVLESAVRFRSGLFFNFNGTAGVWRRSAIEDAGGWSGDTLTEDLDLSYRALLKGWRFIFLSDVTAPAEVPARMNDFKSQQARWTKGSIEVGRRILPGLLRAKLPRAVKLEAFIHLTNNLSYPLVVLLALLIVPSLEIRRQIGWLRLLWLDVPLLLTSSLSVALFYLVSQRELGRDWRRDMRLFPMMMSLGIGMAIGNAIGVVEALFGSSTPFVRTPKRGSGSAGSLGAFYRTGWRPASLAESALTLYFGAAIVACVLNGAWLSVPFLMIFFTGFLYGSLFSILPARGPSSRVSLTPVMLR